jgi:hypothetical protein
MAMLLGEEIDARSDGWWSERPYCGLRGCGTIDVRLQARLSLTPGWLYPC